MIRPLDRLADVDMRGRVGDVATCCRLTAAMWLAVDGGWIGAVNHLGRDQQRGGDALRRF